MTKRRQTSSSSSQDQSSESIDSKFVSVEVFKLTPNVTEQHLHQIFSHFGTVKSVTLTKGPRLDSSAQLTFQKKYEAQSAIAFMNNGYIDGSKIIVASQSQNNKQKQAEKKKSAEKPIKKEYIEKQRKYVKNRYEERRNKQRYSRERKSRNRRRSSSSSSSVAGSSSSSSSDSRSSRS